MHIQSAEAQKYAKSRLSGMLSIPEFTEKDFLFLEFQIWTSKLHSMIQFYFIYCPMQFILRFHATLLNTYSYGWKVRQLRKQWQRMAFLIGMIAIALPARVITMLQSIEGQQLGFAQDFLILITNANNL